MTPDDDVVDGRLALDHIDRRIAGLLALRSRIAREVAASRDGADPGRDPEREREVVENVRRALRRNDAPDAYDVEALYEHVFAATRGPTDEGDDDG